MPKFRILSDEEKKKVMEKFNANSKKFPRILESDAVVKKIGAKVGDMLEIKRTSEVSGESTYYRIVVHG